jgi:hypothetical protein
MSGLRLTGLLLLWAGFLSGALATVFNKEVEGDKWATINWVWYSASLVVGIGGVVLLQATKKATVGLAGASTSSDQLVRHLGNLVKRIGQLKLEHSKQAPRETVAFIESELRDDLREFADGRHSITREHGLNVFAEVMTQFASGERSINRAWSASADGYVDEAARYIDLALDQLTGARKSLQACQGHSVNGAED